MLVPAGAVYGVAGAGANLHSAHCGAECGAGGSTPCTAAVLGPWRPGGAALDLGQVLC